MGIAYELGLRTNSLSEKHSTYLKEFREYFIVKPNYLYVFVHELINLINTIPKGSTRREISDNNSRNSK